MISENVKTYCSEDPSLIENYDKAVEDQTQVWHCHHRAEILPCGRYSQAQLDKCGLLEHVPASQLIFLTKAEHKSLHGRNMTAETKAKISAAKKGVKMSDTFKQKCSESHKGKLHSEATKAKMSASRKGKSLSSATKAKLSELRKGKSSWSKGKHFSAEHKANMSEAIRLWWQRKREANLAKNADKHIKEDNQ